MEMSVPPEKGLRGLREVGDHSKLENVPLFPRTELRNIPKSFVIRWQQHVVSSIEYLGISLCIVQFFWCWLNIDLYTFLNTVKNVPQSEMIRGVTGGHSSFFWFPQLDSRGEITTFISLVASQYSSWVISELFSDDIYFSATPKAIKVDRKISHASSISPCIQNSLSPHHAEMDYWMVCLKTLSNVVEGCLMSTHT